MYTNKAVITRVLFALITVLIFNIYINKYYLLACATINNFTTTTITTTSSTALSSIAIITTATIFAACVFTTNLFLIFFS